MKRRYRLSLVCCLVVSLAGVAEAQFLEAFEDQDLQVDPAGIDGWSFFSGDGQTTIDFMATGRGYASIRVDATRDRRNVWWALIKHRVSQDLDLERLSRPGWELRVEARIRSSHGPRRVNLHVNTQRTTDFHSHLMEYDIPKAGIWYTISMTTRDFLLEPGDTVFAQMALMDWGHDRYDLDVDYFKADVVEAERAGPDVGEPLPYHPPIPDPGSFEVAMQAADAAVVDLAQPDVNLGEWAVLDGGSRTRVLTVGGTMWVILRWDLEAFEGGRVGGHGLLQLTTHSVQRNAEQIKDFGLLRVVEVPGGPPAWRRDTVTLTSLLQGKAI
ncbi:MAG: hypothetical protein MUP13_01725, partial [Thermoanaerobaculales bacterium]|nr:hypothetical protein [Thermoanaerobaculales bacterium]